ncbi:LysE family translocator [Faunimonas sp. B44]|uniref:LysE family translocator n=1 Tax=Faunimonas sp. B44 TaxID=3461493 RepID=UPI0040446A6C
MSPLIHVLLGALIGLAVSIPVGSVAILTAERALHHGFAAALVTASGGALADTIFAAIAAFGVTAISDEIQEHSVMLQLIGSAVLVFVGWRMARRAQRLRVPGTASKRQGFGAFAGAFMLTITNPGALLGSAVLFSSLGHYAPEEGDLMAALSLVIGVALGCAAWWTVVAGTIVTHRHRLAEDWLNRLSHWAGYVLIGFAVLILAQLGLRLSV